MRKGIKVFLIILYVIVLLAALWDLSARFSGSPSPGELDLDDVSLISWLMVFTLPLVLLLCLVSLYLSWKYSLPRYTLIYPIYFLIFVVYQVGTTKLMYWIFPLERASIIVDSLAYFDVIFYVIDLVLASYLLYKLSREPVTS